MASQEQKRKAAAQTGLYLVVVAAIAVIANVLSTGVYTRIDATKNDRHTLSQGSGRLVRGLKSPLQVDAYVMRGIAQLDASTRDLTDLLKEYKRAGGDKFQFTLIEANTDELRTQAKEAGLQEMSVAAESGESGAALQNGYMGLVFKYGSEKVVIPQIPPGAAQGLEFWITNKIREIRDKADNIKHRLGVVTGKDELKLSDKNLMPRQGQGGSPTIQSVLEQSFPFYKIEDLDLKNGDQAIDKDLAGVIITQPQKEYTEKELRRIDEFLMLGGKSLAVYASAATFKPQDPTMVATLDLHGLDKLLNGYGLAIQKDAVLDYGGQFGMMVPTNRGVARLVVPGIAKIVDDPRLEGDEKMLDSGFAGFFRLDEMSFPFPSSIKLDKSKQPADVKIYAVARTTPRTSVQTGATVDMKPRLLPPAPPKGAQAQQVVAAVAEGKLKSAFSVGGEGINQNAQAGQGSRVLVVASSLFLTNPFAYAGNGPELGGQFQMFGSVGGDQELQMFGMAYARSYLERMIISFKNTLDWMSGDQDLLAASAKIISEPNLSYSDLSIPKLEATANEQEVRAAEEKYKGERKAIQQKIQWTLIIGVPVLFGIFGIARWRRRDALRTQFKAA
ncbi:MAG: GldG family protein [Polyangiaceae bacterium]|nr:GldG family protein [Polyangiaceae bacterium]